MIIVIMIIYLYIYITAVLANLLVDFAHRENVAQEQSSNWEMAQKPTQFW